MLTTVYTKDQFEQRLRRRPTSTTGRSRPIRLVFGDEPVKSLPMPFIAAQYNLHMGAVDIGDQLKASTGFKHRICKGNWRAVAWKFLLETSLVNSFLLQQFKEANWGTVRRQVDWRQRIVEDIFKNYGKEGNSRVLFRSGDAFTPRSQHNHVVRNKSANCLACQGFRAGDVRTRNQDTKRLPLREVNSNRRKPAKTRRGCDVCDVALCTSSNCWDFYHGRLA